MDFSDEHVQQVHGFLWLASGLYGAALATGFFFAARSEKVLSKWLPFLLVVGGFIAQTLALGIRGEEVHGCPLGNGMEVIQFILWSVVFGHLIIRVLFRLNLLGSFAAGLASIGGAISLLLARLDPSMDAKKTAVFKTPWEELHASVAIFSYGLFSLLAVVSVMYLIQQNALQTKRRGALAPFLPSIQQLETAGARLLLVGSLFLTGSIVVGSLDWKAGLQSVSLTKVGVTVALWLAYCTLWYLHFRQKLYGKKFAKACIALFVVAILSLGVVRSAAERAPEPKPQSQDVD